MLVALVVSQLIPQNCSVRILTANGVYPEVDKLFFDTTVTEDDRSRRAERD